MLSSIGGGIDARPPTARARYPCPFRLATSLCENPALAQKLIGRHHLAQSRLMAAVAAVAVGVISAHQLAVAAPQRRAVGDRKSVVWGKSVSVRVGCGDRRYIK